MHEVLHWAAGARLPIVMANVNRAMAAPWTMWCDQGDSLAQRDTGWLQFYCEDNQEVLDSIIMAYRISERVLLPSMVCLDGFILSHTYEQVEIPDIKEVDRYLAFLCAQVQAGCGGSSFLQRRLSPRCLHGTAGEASGGHGGGQK